MQTPEFTTFVSQRLESCGAFVPDDAGAPVCVDCGWLADEHPREPAVVHVLPAPARPKRLRRLAS